MATLQQAASAHLEHQQQQGRGQQELVVAS
jgi:hypothetical protein